MEKGAWKRLKSKIVHKNPYFILREDDVLRPSKNQGKYYYVDNINSVTIVAEDYDKKLYLIGISRYPVGNIYSWELVTGGFKPGLNPLQEAKRELGEEIGIIAKKWIKLGVCFPLKGYSSEANHIYLAMDFKYAEPDREETEDITVKKKSLDEILTMIKKDEIDDGMTIYALAKYLIHKNKIKL